MASVSATPAAFSSFLALHPLPVIRKPVDHMDCAAYPSYLIKFSNEIRSQKERYVYDFHDVDLTPITFFPIFSFIALVMLHELS